jgi:two-component system cell cycle sensor histidine kinase/response regulator CckA
MGHAYAGLSKLPDDSPAGSDLDEIEKAAGRAGELTQKLLAFSVRGEMDHQELNVNELITGLEFMLGRLMGEDVEIVLSLEPDLGEVRADQGQLEQILVNLALNAKDAMPTGGTLTIQTSSSALNANDISQRSGKLGEKQVTISVTDTGTGMTQAVKDRVFEPFFSTKDDGSGMGLSTAYGVIKQGGGDIVVESEPGKGTSFTIYLPPLEQAVSTSQTPRTALDLPVGTETVLLVEDEAPCGI